METIAFYSYKGGVGRSLLLANAAQFLATLGKGVVALDFDFEAPGLHYKFAGAFGQATSGGVVPYLVATADGAGSPPSLESHMTSLAVPSDAEGWLRLMPAGPAPQEEYWTALKQFGESLRLDDPSGKGFMAILDLQARIAEELRPDYLLIDARTGVTELGGLATTILADTVVCLFAANQESLDGTLKVVEALKSTPRFANQKPVRIVPVLARATDGPPDDKHFADGVKRLLELSERVSSKDKSKKEATLFALPHDDTFGRTERVVGGQRKASAFSPLYKVYLQLFQELFPARAELAKSVLERLEAVASVRQDLTSSRSDHDEGEGFSPWSSSAITEGVLYEADRYSKGNRYADLVCRSEAAQALIAVEYVADDPVTDALEFWDKKTIVPCIIFLARRENRYTERQIYTRADGRLRRVDRWDLPTPREFELLRDVGDRSIDSMLDALRHGHIEAVAWLVNEWRESVAAGSMHPKREPRWRPERAQRILDGLAATEDLNCAEEILRRTAPDGQHYRGRHSKFHDEWPEEFDQRMADDLFAPLFWRLPIEAALKSMRSRRHPGDTPPIAGHQFVAHQLMGLQFDPERVALEEARELAARRFRSDDRPDEDVDDRAMMWAYRSRQERMERVRLSDEAPPILVWDEVLREEPHWHGTLEEAREKFGDMLRKALGTSASLRRRLRVAADRRELATQGMFGGYDSSGRLELYPAVITVGAEVLGVSPRYLKSVVFIHLSVWDLAHFARDLDGHPGYGFAPMPLTSPVHRPSPAHVTLTQAFTHRLITSLKDPNLEATFRKLSEQQTEPYRRWESMQNLPLERLRTLLLRARASTHALEFPSVEGD